MAIYFKEPYSNYYNELNTMTSLVTSGENIVAESNNLVKIGDKLQSQLENSTWNELGVDQLLNVSIPSLKQRFKALNDNLTYLQLTCMEVINSILPLTISLKEKDEVYEKKLEELANLKEPFPKYIKNKLGLDTNKLTIEYINYENTRMALENDIYLLKQELEKIIYEIDSKVSDIKGLGSKIVSFELVEVSLNKKIDDEQYTILEDKLEEIIESGYEILDDKEVMAGAITYNDGKTLLYNNVGTEEDGYRRLIKTSNGKVMTVFKQGWSSSLKFSDDKSRNLRDHGCAFHAVASILSTEYPNITPEKVFYGMKREKVLASDVKKYLEDDFGIYVGDRNEVPLDNYDAYKQHLVEEVSKGNLVLATVKSGKDERYTKNNKTHWVVIADYDKDADQFYISDSGDRKNVNYEPINTDDFLKKYAVNTNVIYISDDTNYEKYN